MSGVCTGRRMYKYIGENAFLDNVPMRDLTDEEAQKYGIKLLVQSGLYKKTSIENEVKYGNEGTKENSGR